MKPDINSSARSTRGGLSLYVANNKKALEIRTNQTFLEHAFFCYNVAIYYGKKFYPSPYPLSLFTP
jgi:hypothetical protein